MGSESTKAKIIIWWFIIGGILLGLGMLGSALSGLPVLGKIADILSPLLTIGLLMILVPGILIFVSISKKS